MTAPIDGVQLALFDLDPPPPRRGPGRPPREFTPDELLEVRAALRRGEPLWQIAARVGCTVPTLRTHFAGLREWRARRQKRDRAKGTKG
jgi:hypothetical protein